MNKMFEYLTDQPILRWVFGGIGGLYAYIQPTYVYLLVCIFAILLDCFFAWDMARRVTKKYNLPSDLGKFQSKKRGKVFFSTLPKVYGLILLAYFMDQVLIPFQELYLANITAFSFCGWEVYSCLENWSSENMNGFARLLQKIMVNKAERVTGMPISDYLKEIKKEQSSKEENYE